MYLLVLNSFQPGNQIEKKKKNKKKQHEYRPSENSDVTGTKRLRWETKNVLKGNKWKD